MLKRNLTNQTLQNLILTVQKVPPQNPPLLLLRKGSRPSRVKVKKKSRKAIARLGLKPIPGYTRITVKKNKTVLFVIENPDVYKSPSNDTTWVIFGEAKVEDASTEAIKKTVATLDKEKEKEKEKEKAKQPEPVDDEVPDLVAEEPTEVTPEIEKHINAIMEQVNGISRAKAIAALQENNNDVVNTILNLSLKEV